MSCRAIQKARENLPANAWFPYNRNRRKSAPDSVPALSGAGNVNMPQTPQMFPFAPQTNGSDLWLWRNSRLEMEVKMAALNRRMLLNCKLTLLVGYMRLRRRRNKSKQKHRFWVRDIFLHRQERGQYHTLFLFEKHFEIFTCFVIQYPVLLYTVHQGFVID